jgi:glutathione S-transferase
MSAEAGPTLHYFAIKGRGEPIRMTFAACGAQFKEADMDFGKMKAKAGSAISPCGQAPLLEVDGAYLCQMTAIMRFIGAKYKPALIGDGLLQKAHVDMLLNSIDDLYLKYIQCVYGSGLEDTPKAALWAKHFDPQSKAKSNDGAHMAYLVGFIERSPGPFLCGANFTIADIFFYFTLEAYMRTQCFGANLAASYPALTTYMAAVCAVDGLQARLTDPKRAELAFNGNGKG